MNNEIYTKNIATLKKINSKFTEKIQKSKTPEWIEFTDDNKNFIVRKRAKVQEAYPKNYNKEISILAKQKIYFKDTATVIIGAGCGHMLIKILRKMDKGHRIIVVEPVLSLLNNCLKQYDFSKWIAETELVFTTTREEIGISLSLFNELLIVQDWLTIIEPYVMLCEEYSELLSYTNKIIDQIRCNVGTVAGAGSIIAENDIKNIPYIIRDRGIKDLKNIYKNKPAILIATGPAINNNIHLLKSVQDKAIIISIAQGLRMLLAYDVKPDFITTVDYGEINYEHFRGLFDEDVALVALNRTYAPILKHWQGPKFIAGTFMPGFEETATGVIQEKGYLESGGSVVHLSFQLARHMGCDPIIFLGHGYDMGKGKSHTEQVDAGGKIEMKDGMMRWKVTDPRSKIKGQDQFQGAIITLPGIYGEPAYVNVGLASFVTTFEDMFRKSTEKIINASEEGTDMKGTINMTFQKVIDQHLNKEIDKRVFPPSSDPDFEKNIDLTINRLKIDIENLEELKDMAQFGLDSADDMLEYRDKPDDFRKVTELNTKFSKRAQECAKKNPLVAVAIYGVSRQIHSRELKVKGKRGKDLMKNLDTRVKRNKMILEEAKKSAEKLLPSYREVLNTLMRYKVTGDLSLLRCEIKEKINLRDAKKYFKVGNWSHPLVDARKKIAQNKETWWDEVKKELGLFEYGIYYEANERKRQAISEATGKMLIEKRQDKLDYESYIKQAHDLGKGKGKKYKESLRLLKKAEALFLEKMRARWGIATTLLKLNETEKALSEYEKLIEDFPENKRMKFEYGIGLIGATRIDEGIEQIEQAMKDTHEFDHFLRNMGKLYLMKGDKKKAKETFREYLKIYPGDVDIKEMVRGI